MPSSDELFLFNDATNENTFEGEEQLQQKANTWHMLVVDDDEQIHQITQLVLSGYKYQGQSVTLYHAFGKDEALAKLKDNPQICVILLDVVMSTDDEGLECAKAIREELNNVNVRIILRTGQPSTTPEHEVMLNYDINDYKSKTELTRARLFNSITSAIRTYQHLIKLDDLAAQLGQFNLQLEQKVKQRTQELEKSNRELTATLNELTQTKALMQEQQQQLIHSEKLASIGQLAAGVAHEINTPLGYVSSNMETLKDYLSTMRQAWKLIERHAPEQFEKLNEQYDLDYISDDATELVESVFSGLKRIKSISGDLGNYSQLEKSPSNNVDIHDDVIQLALNMVYSELHNNVTIDYTPSRLPSITCYPIELSQVIVNLLLNANDAIAMQAGIEGLITINTHVKEHYLYIQVNDNGFGMDDATLKKLFDPFFTTKPIGSGTGLGLSISHKIVDIHGGKLTVESELNKGSTFSIAIPLR